MHLTRMELGEPDASGRRRPVPIQDGGFILAVDTVLTAIGEDSELDVLPDELPREWGALKADALGGTGHAAWFAGGDLAGEERTVADALGSGKRAAHRHRSPPAASRRRGAGMTADVAALRWGTGEVSASRWRGDDPVRRTNPTQRGGGHRCAPAGALPTRATAGRPQDTAAAARSRR